MNIPITTRRLRAAGACKVGLSEFKKAYPKGMMPVSLNEIGTGRNRRVLVFTYWSLRTLLTSEDERKAITRASALVRSGECITYDYAWAIAFAEIYPTTTSPRLNSFGDWLLYHLWYKCFG